MDKGTYRGIDINTGEYVYGFLLKHRTKDGVVSHYIADIDGGITQIVKDSFGQFVEVTDAVDRLVFQGDKVRVEVPVYDGSYSLIDIGTVVFDKGSFIVEFKDWSQYIDQFHKDEIRVVD